MDASPPHTDGPACPGCAARDREIAALQDRLAALESKVQALTRASKRQAAPFSKGPPRAHPQRPGRKSGDAYGAKAWYRSRGEAEPNGAGHQSPAQRGEDSPGGAGA